MDLPKYVRTITGNALYYDRVVPKRLHHLTPDRRIRIPLGMDASLPLKAIQRAALDAQGLEGGAALPGDQQLQGPGGDPAQAAQVQGRQRRGPGRWLPERRKRSVGQAEARARQDAAVER